MKRVNRIIENNELVSRYCKHVDNFLKVQRTIKCLCIDISMLSRLYFHFALLVQFVDAVKHAAINILQRGIQLNTK